MQLNIVQRTDDHVPIRHVLMSVADKSGLDHLVPGLVNENPDVRIYSTGGTYTAIAEMLGKRLSDRNLVRVSDYTGQPEMQGGLVKTLDFKIYLGLLSETYNDAHRADLERVGGVAFDMVVVNLYPFRQTVLREDVTPELARTNIDIGGPCMVRAAAKNYLRVAALTDPADYHAILEEIDRTDGALTLRTRFHLAKKAFGHTADYDRAITGFLAGLTFEQIEGHYEYGT